MNTMLYFQVQYVARFDILTKMCPRNLTLHKSRYKDFFFFFNIPTGQKTNENDNPDYDNKQWL